jgi:RNA polymerase primary sigma factor
MYLKQMGQVPLLTREQEVEISKRIETAEQHAQEDLFSIGLTAPLHIDLGTKLLNREERFDRLVIDKRVENRENFFKNLPKLIEATEKSEKAAQAAWQDWLAAKDEATKKRTLARFRKHENAARANFPKFFFKLKVFEEFLDALSPALAEMQRTLDDLEHARHPKTR